MTNYNESTDIVIPYTGTEPHSSLAVLSCSSTHIDLRLYVSEKLNGNRCGEVGIYGRKEIWVNGVNLEKSIPLTNLAAVAWDGSNVHRLYTQAVGNDIQEQRWGEGGEWRVGNKIPTA